MNLKKDPPKFRPVTLRLETQDEFDMLYAIVEQISNNKINHTAQVINAAKHFGNMFDKLVHEDADEVDA